MKRLYENASIDGTDYKLVADELLSYKTKVGKLNKGVRCNLNGFSMRAGKVYLSEINNREPESEFIELMREYMLQGVTSILAITEIKHACTFEEEISRSLSYLVNSPIDYALGLRMDSTKVTPDVIRKCARYQVPFIVMDFKREEEWKEFVSEWIVQANFPYHAMLVPLFSFIETWDSDAIELKLTQLLDEAVLKGLDAFHYPELLRKRELPKPILMRIGFYPQKGGILTGTDFDFNLYRTNSGNQVEDELFLDYDGRDPIISGLRGELLKVNHHVFLNPGYGQHLKIHRPSFFTASHRNKKSSVRRSFGTWSVLSRLSH
ncbi:hypothetical protein [Guptibacillus hwajinpoensis]|uniref:hypothetical protein n=1 Tax=Guptibacillus hwajinpoensis TaxID=208199 RepID=UPI0024B37DD6|nr:hypothetical protein [Pseudalkalibacillus hwajinpoensis]